MPDEPQFPSHPGPRRLFAIAFFAAVVGLVIALSFGYADHAPKPQGVRVAVDGPVSVRKQLAAGLQHAAPGGFDVVDVQTAGQVLRSVRSQSTAGGLEIPASGPLTIVTASATGLTQQQAITEALNTADAAMHRPTGSIDVAPLAAGDSAGLSSFVFTLALLIPSVIGAIGLFLVGTRFRLWWRVAAAIFFALLAACGATLVLDTVFGALTGAGAELIGVGFLGALSFVLFVAAAQAVIGLPGTALGALAFIFVGNAISGGSVPIDFLPGGFRQIAPWLPNAAIVRGARDVIYFSGHDLGHPLLVLGLWPAVSLVLIGGVDLLHLGAMRRAPDRPPHEIYMTSGVVHAKRLLGRDLTAPGDEVEPTTATTVTTATTREPMPVSEAGSDGERAVVNEPGSAREPIAVSAPVYQGFDHRDDA
jgi:hypothetical protein